MKFTKLLIFLLITVIIFHFTNCSEADASVRTSNVSTITGPLFKRLSAAETGIDFNNQIKEDETFNHILLDVVFNGGGVAVFDINNDGLQDLFFAGNRVEDKLYLNEGNLKFKDITAASGIKKGTWSTGVTVADVNNDGYLDFYVGKFILPNPEQRRNHLYINNGDLTFTEQAAKYGIADDGHCTAVNFFDYDKDGDMDLYVGNQPFVSGHVKQAKGQQIDKSKYTDRLYRNEGNGKFSDVTTAAGVTTFNYTLSATASDLNNDGWLDLYVASDYEEPDYYFQNNGDGTFTNVIHKAMRHISNFTMGVDLADFNNDGWMDLYSADMAPADNYRTKANMSGMNPEKFWNLANNGFHYQYMFNNLQMNNGNGSFSEIGQMAGVAQTDWSYATLFADFDNDGDKDLYVTNGQPKDTRNKDYIHDRKMVVDSLAKVARAAGKKPTINSAELVTMAPEKKLKNYLFVNNDNLSFSDLSEEWGVGDLSWTQGAVYADLDNDGDLDLVTSNIDDPAFIYENRATQKNGNNFLKLKLVGDHGENHFSHGAKAWIYHGDEMQVLEVSPTRGYMSTNDPVLHFGLGKTNTVDKLIVRWLDGRQLEMKNIDANKTLTLKQSAAKHGLPMNQMSTTALFKDVTLTTNIDYFHKENKHDDFASEVLLPHRMSHLGPCAVTADINGDGLEDVFLGGAAGQSGTLYLQVPNNKFVKNNSQIWSIDKKPEDVNALFFDADGDKDQDLYVVSGGNDFAKGASEFQDRLYINDGKGNFTKGQLPKMLVSGGVAKAGDLDGDGDLDLFVGGRQIPNQYGYAAPSFILRNDNGKFSNQTATLAPSLEKAGMVTDAIWMDIDNDKDNDLLVVGEWMAISVFENEGGKLKNVTEAKGLENTHGWWNRIVAADMDGDGDQDLIAGNLGLNIKFKATPEKPFSVKIKDFDENGTNDIYLAYYDQDGELYPVRGRQCSSQQMPFIEDKFKTYNEFAKASFDDVLGDLATDALTHEIQMFESVYLENLGDGKFDVQKLPMAAQTAPMYGILPRDWNGDGHMDILVAGNYYEREVETTRSDAGIGTMLLGDGKGNFKAISPSETGIIAYLDVRALATVENNMKKPLVIIVNNNFGLQVYEGQRVVQ